MIRYSLKCANGHAFDSWFQSASAFDALATAGHLECPLCGTSHVEKAMMAPRVNSDVAKPASEPHVPVPMPAAGPDLTAMAQNMPKEVQDAFDTLRKQVEANSDYVGRDFALEARAIHDGTSPERAIHGEANADEAKALIEDGVPILPLPFRDRRGTN